MQYPTVKSVSKLMDLVHELEGQLDEARNSRANELWRSAGVSIAEVKESDDVCSHLGQAATHLKGAMNRLDFVYNHLSSATKLLATEKA